MKVDLYALCWNDKLRLPWFFRHYDSFVDRYVIFDDGSTDGSLTLLSNHPKVEVRRFLRSDPQSFALSELSVSNQCWKESRGKADWVIVTDIDEHLFHPFIRDYLRANTEMGVTLIPALGFQMISESFPDAMETLSEVCPMGAPWAQMMKASIFDPGQIEEINFSIGRHRASPDGNIQVPNTDELLLFHYKYLGFMRTLTRHRELAAGLRSKDIEAGWGKRYRWSLEEFQEDWRKVLAGAIDTREIRHNPSRAFPEEPWWHKYRR